MMNYKKCLVTVSLLLALVSAAHASEGVEVVYPGWFKHSLYDLQGDIQDAKDAGKNGIMVFFSTKTCSYCKAIIESTFQQDDIVKKLRANYDVIGIEVLSDTEIVDTGGKSLWAKDFAVQEKAKFTPTMIFYDTNGSAQLRLVGYQSPDKFRGVLGYLEGKHFTRMKLSDYLNKTISATTVTTKPSSSINLVRSKTANKPLLLVFESAECSKCQQLRTMLKAPVLQAYTKKFDIVSINSTDTVNFITTPSGKKVTGKTWNDQLELIHSPAMLFYDEKGVEVLRVDTDILVDEYGKDVSDDNAHILDNIRGRFMFVLDKGYISLPQYQRWRAQRARNK